MTEGKVEITTSKTPASLFELIDNTRTDKNNGHNYLATYTRLFEPMRESARIVAEIGVDKGGSIQLWSDYFLHATVIGMDITKAETIHAHPQWNKLHERKNVQLFTGSDAYNPEFVKREFADKAIQFDVLIDDGPHSLDSMKKCISLYGPLLSETGVLVIEDLQEIGWTEQLRACVPANLQCCIEVVDLRHIQNRWDDIIFIIDKRKQNRKTTCE